MRSLQWYKRGAAYDSTKHKLEETVKATDKPPPFVTLFRCSNEYITLPSFIKPKAATTRH